MESKFHVIILEKAFHEIENAKDYYENKQNKLGNEFTKEVFELLEVIEDNPFLFQIKFKNIREANIKKFPFIVIFEVLPQNEIIILSVFHFKRNPDDKTLSY